PLPFFEGRGMPDQNLGQFVVTRVCHGNVMADSAPARKSKHGRPPQGRTVFRSERGTRNSWPPSFPMTIESFPSSATPSACHAKIGVRRMEPVKMLPDFGSNSNTQSAV